jgi:hypothetical protein
MAFRKFSTSLSPEKDAGWGLIFRLNSLWAKVDIPAESGDYDSWNTVLDRIFCNLLYRNKMDIVLDEQGRVQDVKINEDSYKVYAFLTKKIFEAKIDYHKSIRAPPNLSKSTILKSRWYHAVMLKDIWLRKYMQELGLYLKEIERAPGSALFGGDHA